MAMSPEIRDREHEKFKDTAQGTAVKVAIVEGSGGGGGGGSAEGIYNATPITLADQDTVPLQLDVNGNLLTKDKYSEFIKDGVNEIVNAVKVNVIDAGTGNGHNSSNMMVGGLYLENSPTLIDGDQSELQLDSKGNLKTVIESMPTVSANIAGSVSVDNFPPVQPTAIVDPVYVADQEYNRVAIPIGGYRDESEPSRFYPINVQADGSVLTRAVIQGIPVVSTGDDIYINNNLASTVPINTNLFQTFSTTSGFDLGKYSFVSFTLLPAAGTTNIVVNFEGSNDNFTTVSAIGLHDTINTSNAPTSSYTTAAGTVRGWAGKVPFRYFRVRISAAITSGSIALKGLASLRDYNASNQPVNITSGTLTSVTTVSTVSSALLQSTTVTVIASAAITSSNTTAGTAVGNIQSCAFTVLVTAVSGTNPTYDLDIEVSRDNVNWKKLYSFERITASGSYWSPVIAFEGTHLRCVQTVSGTTPSFTRSVSLLTKQIEGRKFTRFIDRTLNLNSLGSVTPTYEPSSCKNFSLVVVTNSGGTGPSIIDLQGSEDSSNWFDLGVQVSINPSETKAAYNTIFAQPKFVRARVSTASTGMSLNYCLIKGQE